jgi:His-Xaa-Ser system protein HxsD
VRSDTPFRVESDAIYIDVYKSVYSLPTVIKASYLQTDYCSVIISDCDAFFLIRLAPLKNNLLPDNFQEIGNTFCNRLLEEQMREQVLGETKEIRNSIVKRAFASGNIEL